MHQLLTVLQTILQAEHDDHADDALDDDVFEAGGRNEGAEQHHDHMAEECRARAEEGADEDGDDADGHQIDRIDLHVTGDGRQDGHNGDGADDDEDVGLADIDMPAIEPKEDEDAAEQESDNGKAPYPFPGKA